MDSMEEYQGDDFTIKMYRQISGGGTVHYWVCMDCNEGPQGETIKDKLEMYAEVTTHRRLHGEQE